MPHNYKRCRPVSTDPLAPPCMFMVILPLYLLRQAFPLFTLHRTSNLHNSDFDCTPHPPATIQHFLWQLWQPLLQTVPLNTLETCMQTAVCHVHMAHRDPASPLPQNVNMAKILNKEKSYKKYLESQCSDQCGSISR